jgi:hypothetical protein
MFDKGELNFLRVLGGVFGVVSLFLPWWIADLGGYIVWFYPMGFWFSGGDYISGTFGRILPMSFSVLMDVSVILAVTVALVVLGCLASFFSSFTLGIKGRGLAFVGGISFCLAPIIFVAGLSSLFSSAGRVFWGGTNGFNLPYESSPSVGFYMAFVAAVPVLLSLGNLKRIKRFLLFWFVGSGVLMIFFLLAEREVWQHYGLQLGPFLFASFFWSLVVTSVCTFVFGVYQLFKKNQSAAEPS